MNSECEYENMNIKKNNCGLVRILTQPFGQCEIGRGGGGVTEVNKNRLYLLDNA